MSDSTNATKPVEESTNEPEVISFRGENGHNALEDYAILCKDAKGLVHRYEAHKEVLAKGSGLFHDMFDTCTACKGSSESKLELQAANGEKEELEVSENDEILNMLLSVYSMDAALKRHLERKEEESLDTYSR